MQKENETVSLTPWALQGFTRSTGEVPFRITALGLEVTEDLTLDEIKALLVAFKGMDSACALNLADLLSYGKKMYGGEQMEMLLETVEFDYVTARKAISLADIPVGLRHVDLEKEHYFVVAALEYVDQVRWLDLAIKEKLSALELQRSIEAGRILRKADIAAMSGSGSGVFTYQGILTSFDRWCRKVGGDEKILSWDAEQKRRWLTDMSAVLQLAGKVQRSLES
jgi:hypothetical protein